MGNRVIFSSLPFHDFIQQYISKMRIDSCTELIPLSIPGSQFLLTFFLVPKFCLSKNVCKIVMLKQREYQLTDNPCNQTHWRGPAHSRTCAEKRLGQHVTGFLRPYLYHGVETYWRGFRPNLATGRPDTIGVGRRPLIHVKR